MIKGGKGGSLTRTGIRFEQRTDLRDAFGKQPGYSVVGNDLCFKGNVVAQMYRKNEFNSTFLKKHNINPRHILSKVMIPDETVFVMNNNTLFVIEMKFQHVEGSVDEKLQTCDFKKKQYQKLLAGTGMTVEYIYVLNNWFNNQKYKDLFEYIDSVGCRYFFDVLLFKALGLPDPER